MGDLAIASGSSTALYNQVQHLQRQCVDWLGCDTTSTSDKQKIVGKLQEQIGVLQNQIQALDDSRLQQAGSAKVPEPASPGDGINRPHNGLGAGGIINLSV